MHPYDDPAVIAGQGTVALELLQDHPELDALVVPTGGGGLLAGMAVVARALRPDLVVHGAQSDRWPSMLEATTATAMAIGGPTIAEGIAVPVAGMLTQAIVKAAVDQIFLVHRRSGGGGDEPAPRHREGRGRGRGGGRGRRPARAPRGAAGPRTSGWCSPAATSTLGCSPRSSCAVSCGPGA